MSHLETDREAVVELPEQPQQAECGVLPEAAPAALDASMPATLLPKVYVVLPAFNEGGCLATLLERIQSTFQESPRAYDVIVVDDGSSDDTALVASKASFNMPVDLVQHPANQGLAAALRTGLMTAASMAGDEDVIVTMDADDTHPPTLIPSMLERLDEGLDVVIASRYRPGAKISGVPANRSFLSFGARWMFQSTFPIRGVRDYTCGYRAYRAAILKRALGQFGDRFITEQGFSSSAEILLKLRACQATMGEVPLELRYERRGTGSKMRVARTVAQTLTMIARQRLLFSYAK